MFARVVCISSFSKTRKSKLSGVRTTAKDLQGLKKDGHTGLSRRAGSVVYSLLSDQIT